MENIHKKAIQKTWIKLVNDLEPGGELLDQLLSEGIFTPIMLEDIMAEKTRNKRVRCLLNILTRRGPKAYAIFLKCLRNSEQEHLANAVEDNEYHLRGIPPPLRGAECQGMQGQSSTPAPPVTIYTRQQGPATIPEQTIRNTEIRHAPQSSTPPSLGFPTAEQFQPSQDNNPCGSLLAPSGMGINQGLTNQMAGSSHVAFGQGTSSQRNEAVMEVTDSQPVMAPPPSTAVQPPQSAYQRVSLDRKYRMESIPRGLCLIINNNNYTNMRIRTGTDVDRDKLQDLFINLNFWVDVKNDLTGMEMKRTLEELTAYEGLTSVDSLVVCLLCHGDNENVHGTDGVALNLLNDVFKIFGPQSCPALIGKPKLFVLNSCRGAARDVGNHYNTIGNNIVGGNSETDVTHHRPRNAPNVGPTTPLRLPQTNPSFKDLYIAYSTFQGHVSYRNRQDGSWFIQKLVDVFREEASINDIDIMMREVNRRVANEYDASSLEVQMPAPSNTLTRQWCFNPGP